MSAQPTSPGSSEVAADQPKDRNEPLPDAQPKSQVEDQDNPADKSASSASPEDKEDKDRTSAAPESSTKSPASPQSQESGEASPVPSVHSGAAAAESSAPPLPNEPPPATEDDGWDFHWDATNQAYFFHNRFTNETTWENPRLRNNNNPSTSQSQPAPSGVAEPPANERPPAGGYNPAIHGDYDPNAWYAKSSEENASEQDQSIDPAAAYAAMGTFNRFTGRWQAADQNPERYNDEAKSRRQMNAFFDVDAAANSHDGRSLKAERSGKKPTKAELKQFKEKRRAKKEEKRRAWLRD
ncbi:hypothetical protein F5Y13DRAFT_158063 [Hypoxylon sp. FL1857]|nr:hypothetical protein F5Y13DRAFT_158063 [Hypoxylon sp. FL1857]